MSASEQIASQFANASLNKKQWGSIGYNAIVEGVIEGGVTDTTAQLQTLVNKAISEGRRTIFLPHVTNGQYRVTALTNADQVDFVGDNCTFVGGYTGTIGDLGGFASLEADLTQLEANFTQLDSEFTKRVVSPTQPITAPAGLGFTPPITIPFIKKDGKAAHDYDVSVNAPTGKTYYVDLVTGNDTTNTGLTPNSAFRTMNKATSMADAVVIRVAAGTYYWSFGPSVTINKAAMSIISEGGKSTFSVHDNLTWTVSATYTYTYEATRSSVASVWDTTIMDKNGDYTPLTLQASIAAVDANPGSWYTDGTKVYVRTRDSRAITNNSIRAYLNVDSLRFAANGTLYLENINFEGGKSAVSIANLAAGNTTKFYAKNCSFKYANSSNGLTVLGAVEVILQDCVAARNYLDGFNYHIQNGVIPRAIEVDCIGRTNGIENGHNNNGSTMHDGGKVVRVNGVYFGNDGPNIADVNDSFTWMVASQAFQSTPTDSNGTNYYNDGLMWLDSCVSYGSVNDLTLAGSGTTYIRNFLTEGNNNIGTGSSVVEY